MLEPVAEESPVRELGQWIVERLVADPLVEAGVLERHRCLVGHRLGEPEAAAVEEDLAGRGQLDEADRLALRHERQHRRALVADRTQVADLGGAGTGVVNVDHALACLAKHGCGLRVVGQRVRVLERGAPLGRVVAVGDDPFGRAVPVADRALVDAGGRRDVPRNEVPDALRLEAPGELARHREQAAQLVIASCGRLPTGDVGGHGIAHVVMLGAVRVDLGEPVRTCLPALEYRCPRAPSAIRRAGLCGRNRRRWR